MADGNIDVRESSTNERERDGTYEREVKKDEKIKNIPHWHSRREL